uniref:Uncharacterized protein n=1 Tax=Siphoviridae sp. ctDhw1 TaxID=2827813 RepID=A0A8S5SII7_9CAUD|nr:MAG TPA: hypothetical protein [Siphoviridae sp. ctDhw1]
MTDSRHRPCLQLCAVGARPALLQSRQKSCCQIHGFNFLFSLQSPLCS